MSDTGSSDEALSGGVIHSLGRAVHWVVGLMEPVRHLVMNLTIMAGVVVGGPAVYKQVTKSSFVIKDISVPPAISSRGLPGDVIAQQILDHIAEIDRQAGSKKEKAEISGFDSGSSMPAISLPVGGLNLGAIIAELRTLFGYAETKVTGEIYIAQPADSAKGTSDLYGLRLRIAGQGPLYHSEQPSNTVEPLVEQAAQQIMRRYDPINLGYYYYRKKNYQRATEITDEVLAGGKSSDVPWAFMMRGLIAREQGHMAEAVVDLRQAVARAPDFLLGYVTLASLLRQSGAMTDAEAAARKAIELAPNQNDGHAALAMVLAQSNRSDEALAEMQKGIDLDPKASSAYFRMGRLQMRLHKLEDAVASFKQAAVLLPAAAPLMQAASALHDLKRDDEAVELLLQATHVEPKNPRTWLALGVADLDLKAYGRASRALQKGIALDVDSPETLVAAAKAWDDHKRSADADHIYAQAAPKLTRHPVFLLGLSEHLWTEGHKPEAATKLREALASERLTAPEARSAGVVLEARGDTAGALEAYKRAVVLDPSLEKALQPMIDKLATTRTDAVAATPPAVIPPPAPAPRPASPVVSQVAPAAISKPAPVVAPPSPSPRPVVVAPVVAPRPQAQAPAAVKTP